MSLNENDRVRLANLQADENSILHRLANHQAEETAILQRLAEINRERRTILEQIPNIPVPPYPPPSDQPSDFDYFRDKIQRENFGGGTFIEVPIINHEGKINLIAGSRCAGELTKGRARIINTNNYTRESLEFLKRCCNYALNAQQNGANYVVDPIARQNIQYTLSMCEDALICDDIKDPGYE